MQRRFRQALASEGPRQIQIMVVGTCRGVLLGVLLNSGRDGGSQRWGGDQDELPWRYLPHEWRIKGGVEDALERLSWNRIGREVSNLAAAADEAIDHLALRSAIRACEQLCQRFVHHPPPSSFAERTGQAL
jgi:hypothetical protein